MAATKPSKPGGLFLSLSLTPKRKVIPMCMIACQMPGSDLLPERYMRNAWRQNHDGSGYMFSDGEKLIIRKPFFKLKDFIRSYQADFACYGSTSPFVLHWRYTTHGENSEINTHPHVLIPDVVGLVHNGILPIDPPSNKISDTVYFCQTVLAKRDHAQLLDPLFAEWLGDIIGQWNKFVILDAWGNFSIVNEDCGHWDGLVWFSNYDYLPNGKSYIGQIGNHYASYPVDGKQYLSPFDEIEDAMTGGGSCCSAGYEGEDIDLDTLDESDWKSALHARLLREEAEAEARREEAELDAKLDEVLMREGK